MKKLIILTFSVALILGFGSAYGQMKPQTPTQVKPPVLGKTYWCAEVQDILFSKEPQQGQKLNVGVRVKFTKKTVIPGTPGQKPCDCAFEGPPDAPVKFWSKTMSLRLIGIKYSETETNLLEYYGPTPAFPPYDYSGFQVIGFTVTENDLKKGYIDVWGWTSKEPLQCREASIYASLAVYNQSPYNKQNECHPHPDFKKSFKPKCLEVSKISEEKVKKGAVLRIPPEKFLIEKLPPIKFVRFDRSDFKIPPEQKTITLKEKTIMFRGRPVFVRKAKTIDVETFLKEVNEIEEGLNKLGYTLRDDTPIKIKYIYPRDQFKLQKETLSKDFLKKVTIPLPPQVECYSDYSDSSQSGHPTDPVPFDWRWNWDESFGNEDFGIGLNSHLWLNGNQDNVDVDPFFNASITLFGKNEKVLWVQKSGNEIELCYSYIGSSSCTNLNTVLSSKSKFSKNVKWGTEVEFPVGPINIIGEFGFKGEVGIEADGSINLDKANAQVHISPYINASAYGEVGASYKIVSVGIGANLVLIDDTLDLNGKLQLIPKQSQQEYSYFLYTVEGTNKMTLLSGSLYVWGEIDLLFGSKKFEIEFYNFDGYNFDQKLFSISNRKVPAERDHHAYLKIDEIRGITAYTARNEKLYIEPEEFELIIDIDGRTYTKTLKDFNKDGIWGNAIGEYEDQIFEIPLLSYKKVPISIEVVEKYKMGTLEFKNTVDLAKGPWKKVELCYDPKERSFTGTKSGGEEDEIISVGDTNYWGERNHAIRFKIGPREFKAAPAKAK